MSIVVFSDVIVPNGIIMAGVSGTQMRQNTRGQNQGGYATVSAVRDVTMRAYQLGIAPMMVAAWAALEGMYEVTDAGAFGMLLEDPKDSTVSIANGGLQGYVNGIASGVTGFGHGGPLYGLRKLYSVQGSSRIGSRAVTRPNGTPALFRGGSPVTAGVSAGMADLSAAPVYASFTADQTRSIVSLTVGATTQVTLGSAIGISIGGRLWLQGLTGADAALLNGQSHAVTAVTGAVYTLATDTTGKTITFGAAAAHKYPQPDEALTWSGQFYVPVHFRDDKLDWEMVVSGPRDSRYISGPSVWLDEIREA